MPVSSLPSDEGIGTLGADAYKFIDFLKDSGLKVWQVLPLNPTNYGDSPYQSCCSEALNYYFIDLHALCREGLLTREELDGAAWGGDPRKVDYGTLFTLKTQLLRKAFSRFDRDAADFRRFVEEGVYDDFAAFMTVKCRFGHRAWTEWEPAFRRYDKAFIDDYIRRNSGEYLFWQFTQFAFLKQWRRLKEYANFNGVRIMGDIPLYLAYDSAEMWKYGDKLFKVDKDRAMSYIAGCPPDGFTADGQLWGNPVYDWQRMKADGYDWWNRRIDGCFCLYDMLRIDHFRGFDRYYEVPVGEKTAKNGRWADGPKEALFAGKEDCDIVAEDLGVLDEGVYRLMRNVGYPGMKVLEYAFDGCADNEHKPTNHTENFVCYTGTHDNMPIRQYIDDLPKKELAVYKKDLAAQCRALGVDADLSSSAGMCRTVVKLAFASAARMTVVPLSDLLAMGGEARMNLPSTVSDKNWSWRFVREDFSEELKNFLKGIVISTNRL